MPLGAATCPRCRGRKRVWLHGSWRACPDCGGVFGADRARIDAEQSLIYCAKNLRDGKGSRWNLERQVRACSAKYGTSVERLSDLTKLSRREIRSILKGQESLGV